MIKANELRVGNILHFYKPVTNQLHILVVKGIYYDDQIHNAWFIKNDQYADINEKGLSPIPLTPEWLERCGFEYHMPYHLCGAFIISENRYRDGSGNYDGFHMKIRIEDRIMPMVIRSVHQLQNLYFALTGEELNVKP